jgi:glucose uptake protein
VAIFSAGLVLSNFVWNSIVMKRPFVGDPVPYGDYFTKGNARLHLVGILGGVIWSVGMSFSIIASGAAGPSISYGLGQGATMVAAFWGVFVWKEFKQAPPNTGRLLSLMFVFYIVGLGLIVYAGT